MRIWFKMMKDNHLLRDTTITDESDDTRTHKIFRAIDEVCYALILENQSGSMPMLPNSNAMQRQDLPRTVSLSRSILIFWRCM